MASPVVDGKKVPKKPKKSTKKKPLGRQRLSIKTVVKAIQGTGGIVSQIAEKLQCARQTVYVYIKKYPEVKEAYDNEKEMILDVCEEGLFAKIYGQDFDAIKYYLERKGKSRGYGGQDQFGKGPDEDSRAVQSGVLVTPGMLTEGEWEAATQK